MKKVAIPINNGKLSQYFGQCSYYKIFEIEGDRVHEKELSLPLVNSKIELPTWAAMNGITDIITYKIDPEIITQFIKYKINLFVGIAIDTPEKLIIEFIRERMTSNNSIISEIISKK